MVFLGQEVVCGGLVAGVLVLFGGFLIVFGRYYVNKHNAIYQERYQKAVDKALKK